MLRSGEFEEIVMREMSIVAFLSAVFVVTPVIADAQTNELSARSNRAA
jgi:hypothetical protein